MGLVAIEYSALAAFKMWQGELYVALDTPGPHNFGWGVLVLFFGYIAMNTVKNHVVVVNTKLGLEPELEP